MSYPTSGAKSSQTSDEHFDLADYVAQKETDDNLKRLAEIMAAEWKPESETPNLSFSKFEEKLNALKS